MRKKERKNDKNQIPGSDMYNHFRCMFLVSIDRKFAGDYDYHTSSKNSALLIIWHPLPNDGK